MSTAKTHTGAGAGVQVARANAHARAPIAMPTHRAARPMAYVVRDRIGEVFAISAGRLHNGATSMGDGVGAGRTADTRGAEDAWRSATGDDGAAILELTLISEPGAPDTSVRQREILYVLPLTLSAVADHYARWLVSGTHEQKLQAAVELERRLALMSDETEQAQEMMTLVEEIRRHLSEHTNQVLGLRRLATWRCLQIAFDAAREADAVDVRRDGGLGFWVNVPLLAAMLYGVQGDRRRPRRESLRSVLADIQDFERFEVRRTLIYKRAKKGELRVTSEGPPIRIVERQAVELKLQGWRQAERSLVAVYLHVPSAAATLFQHPEGWGSWLDVEMYRYARVRDHAEAVFMSDYLDHMAAQAPRVAGQQGVTVVQSLRSILSGCGLLPEWQRRMVPTGEAWKQRKQREYRQQIREALFWLAQDKLRRGMWASCRIAGLEVRLPRDGEAETAFRWPERRARPDAMLNWKVEVRTGPQHYKTLRVPAPRLLLPSVLPSAEAE